MPRGPHLLPTLAATLLLASCTASPSSSDAEGGAVGPSVRCAPDAPRYHAFLASGSCVDVDGVGGVWTAVPSFPDAPPAIRGSACTYRWSPTEDALPDVRALDALDAELLTKSVEEAPSCDAPVLAPGTLTLTPVSAASGDGPPTGVTGCDVCGRVVERQVFVILPADQLELRTLLVTTSGGNSWSFSAPGSSQLFSAELPATPDGESYLGRATLFQASF